MAKGWIKEPRRHGLAAKGIKTAVNNPKEKAMMKELEYKDFNQQQKTGIKKFSALTSKEMEEYEKFYESITGRRAGNINNKGDFYEFVNSTQISDYRFSLADDLGGDEFLSFLRKKDLKTKDMSEQEIKDEYNNFTKMKSQESQEAQEMAAEFGATEVEETFPLEPDDPFNKVGTKGWEKQLSQFTGTENYYKGWAGVQETEGVKYVSLNAGWLVTDMESVLRYKKNVATQPFISVKVTAKDNEAAVRYEDGNGKRIHTQKYEYAELPDGEYKFYYADGVLMLASEY